MQQASSIFNRKLFIISNKRLNQIRMKIIFSISILFLLALTGCDKSTYLGPEEEISPVLPASNIEFGWAVQTLEISLNMTPLQMANTEL